VTVLLWLGPLNIMLAVFNLVPGFPLDGGRILRALIWAATGDLTKATRWAARTGQAFGLLLVCSGVSMLFGLSVPFFGRGAFGGLWIAFIGWFLYSAARASYSNVVLRDLLTGVPVAKVMTTHAINAPADADLSTLASDYLMGTDQRAFPVVDGEHGDRLVGVVTLDDLRHVPREQWPRQHVRDIMTKRGDLVVTTPEEDMASAEEKLMSRGVQQLPVVEGDRVLGLLRQRDVLRWLELQSTGAFAR
jgi:CBS domain-containing protein